MHGSENPICVVKKDCRVVKRSALRLGALHLFRLPLLFARKVVSADPLSFAFRLHQPAKKITDGKTVYDRVFRIGVKDSVASEFQMRGRYAVLY